MELEGERRVGLVDTGCSVMLINAQVAQGRQRFTNSITLETMDGRQARTLGSLRINSMTICGNELGYVQYKFCKNYPLV